MMEWPLPIAKSKLGELITTTCDEGPQIIALRDERKVVVISADEYDALIQRQRKEPLVEFLRTSPLVEAKLDLERSRYTSRETTSYCIKD